MAITCTITTDISHHPVTNVAAYAFWVSGLGPPIRKSGLFKTTIPDATIAEIFCIANALVYTVQKFPMLQKVWINTDSRTAILLMTKEKIAARSKNQKFMPAVQIIRDLQKKYPSLELEWRKVSAHVGTRDKRTFVNDWADKESRRLQRMESKRLKLENSK